MSGSNCVDREVLVRGFRFDVMQCEVDARLRSRIDTCLMTGDASLKGMEVSLERLVGQRGGMLVFGGKC